jgi:hypothetical protein
METTENKLTANERIFFDRLRSNLDTQLYFFGSVQRNDYFRHASDIDIDLFSFNEKTLIAQLQSILNITKVKTFVYKPLHSKTIIKGYKMRYEDEENGFNVEFSIYNEKYKEEILFEHKRKFSLPFYVLYPLIILKYLYYRLQILPRDVFSQCKNQLLGLVDDTKTDYVII